MSVDDIRNVLTVRHRLSGYDLRFVHHSPRLHEWLRNPATAWGIRRGSAQAIFDRIWLLSRGNVKQALLLWLALARRAPIEDNTVLVGPVDALPDRLIDGLPLIARTILAALVLHGPLSREELTAMCSGNGRELDTEIARLAHQGFVTLGAAGERSVLDKAEHIGVPPRLMQPLTEELRSCNLL
jgi:hypothetical protein